MPQKEYNRLFITGKYRENWYHNSENWSQPCGLLDSKNWNLYQEQKRKIYRRRSFKLWKLNLTSVFFEIIITLKLLKLKFFHLPALDQP